MIAFETEVAQDLAESELREWVRHHRVCWETAVHRDRARQGVMPVGYDVVLSALCLGVGAWDPGGDEAGLTLARLQQLAVAVIPTDCEDDVGLGPFEPTLQLRAQAGWEPEVRLVIEIRHAHEYFTTIDDDERSALHRVERALEQWGACSGSWTARRPPA